MKAWLWIACAIAVAAAIALAARDRPAAAEAALEYALVDDWGGAEDVMGSVSAVDVDAEGNVYAFRRAANDVRKLAPGGELLEEWDQNFAEWAHGIRVGPEGFVWTIDGGGHQVKKWTSDGSTLLMTLGSGEAGDGPDTFNRPTDVAFGPDGEIFVSDGYRNSRVVKFDREGRYLTSWGEEGTGPGQFDLVHTIVVDRRDRVLVGDRENARIQIFDLDGNFLEQWDHLGSPYGLALTEDDLLYVADLVNARVWIARASDGELVGTIEGTEAIHWIAVDGDGNVYAATPADSSYYAAPEDMWYLRKYRKVAPE